MTRERCRIHGLIFAVSLVGVPYCPICRREDHAAIDQLVRTGKQLADQSHTKLLAVDEERRRPAR